ncbi:AraC family transcriptional regulator [Flavobacterium sp. NKUCC04_CG]|uniref:AraC family transcriptional regulator n=1 Tax=Flavobacterium sp. NKUCC04_CG TaxID=2842121 RepID=UPI001C5BEEA4|nr:AraC family transcriptional regulator [Flavobacterium sp. NKUCC04_CG]MBW3518093.1 AraC family transcriptional regulator [Flavobacterium sp. NKUCC04_CG]
MAANNRIFFNGLYGSDCIEFVKGLIYVYPFGIIGRKNNNNVKPHAHNNQFQIFVVLEGETHLLYNKEVISVQGPAFITVPKNTDHGFEHRTNLNGWIISLSDNVIEHMVKREAEVIEAIELFQVTPIVTGEYSEEVFKTMLYCIEEFNATHTGRLLMLEHLVGRLIVQLKRLPQSSQHRILFVNNSFLIYYRRFTQLIRESCSYKKTIEEYAADLKITSGHLSRICNSVAFKSPREIIMDFYLTQAQLSFSDGEKSIADVSYELGFDDPSYFARVFKRKIGLTPNEFRKKIRTKD